MSTAGLDYTPYGDPIAGAASSLTPYAFTGQPLDSVLGLQYHRARWLNTGTGNWLSQDPVFDFPNNFGSMYGYVGGNVTNLLDITGKFGDLSFANIMATCAVIGLVVGAGVGGVIGGVRGAVYGAIIGLIVGAFVAVAWGEAIFIWAALQWQKILALGLLAGPLGSRMLTGPYGKVSLRFLDHLAKTSSNNMITLYTRLTSSPSAHRVLHVATDVRLANAGERISRTLYTYRIPENVLYHLERIGLISPSTTREVGTIIFEGRAYKILPEAIGYIQQFMVR